MTDEEIAERFADRLTGRRKFHVGDRVRFIGTGDHFKTLYGDRVRTVKMILLVKGMPPIIDIGEGKLDSWYEHYWEFAE